MPREVTSRLRGSNAATASRCHSRDRLPIVVVSASSAGRRNSHYYHSNRDNPSRSLTRARDSNRITNCHKYRYKREENAREDVDGKVSRDKFRERPRGESERKDLNPRFASLLPSSFLFLNFFFFLFRLLENKKEN